MFSESVKSGAYIGSVKSSDIIAQTAWSTSHTEQTFQIPNDGWLVGMIGNKGASGGSPETNGVVIKINNIIVAEVSNQNTEGIIQSICLPVKKGQSFSFATLTGSWLAKLYYVNQE